MFVTVVVVVVFFVKEMAPVLVSVLALLMLRMLMTVIAYALNENESMLPLLSMLVFLHYL